MPIDELLEDWRRRARESQHAHYETAKHFSRLNYMFGVLVVIATTVVGTSIFATLQEQGMLLLRVILGFISVAAAVLAALQTFLRYAERSEKHRAAGAAFGAIRRELEQMKAQPEGQQGDLKTFLDSVRERFDSLAQQTPEIPAFMWEKLHRKAG